MAAPTAGKEAAAAASEEAKDAAASKEVVMRTERLEAFGSSLV